MAMINAYSKLWSYTCDMHNNLAIYFNIAKYMYIALIPTNSL